MSAIINAYKRSLFAERKFTEKLLSILERIEYVGGTQGLEHFTNIDKEKRWIRKCSKEMIKEACSALAPFDPSAGWLPIENAPKDEKLLAFFDGWGAQRASYVNDQYASKPCPYWCPDAWRNYGLGKVRKNQPMLYMPLPAPPEERK